MNNIYPITLITKRTIALLLVITFIFSFSIWWLNHSSFFQNTLDWFAMDNRLEHSFCEKTIISNQVRQPINTFSSIIYLFFAVIILKNKNRNTNHISDNINQFYEFLLGLLLVYVFICSVFFHATLADISLKLDFTAVCALVSFPSIYFLNNLIHKNKKNTNHVFKSFFILFFFITFILLSLTTHHEKHRLLMFLLIIIFFIISFIVTNKSNTDRKYLFFSMASIIVAIIWLELDKYNFFCNPDGYFQPHSLWHVFSGFSAFYFYMFCRIDLNKPA